ncbi:ExbD/TolR family protein [Kiloniella majae]|uniref:ExbD/TolR family protein n=1 Tax=Kiloniella majae TaxID=1938558 RepID=UPI000A279517|nr:biopolymer transporter ExbD [Kiloniella majae]
MRLSGESTDKLPTISLTPLIDVVFILLIFFMLASSFLDWRELPIQGQAAKPSSSPSSQSPKETIRLSLSRDGTIKLGSKKIDRGGLKKVLMSKTTTLETIKVYIAVEDGVRMQNTLDFLQELKAFGLIDLTLQDQQKS